MNLNKKRLIAKLLLIAILFVNLFPVPNGSGEVIVTPMVETAVAATPTPTPTPVPATDQFFMVVNSNKVAFGEEIKMTQSTMSLSITDADNSIPTDATIAWLPYDSKVIKLDGVDADGTTATNKFIVSVDVVGPGYSQLGAIITYGGVHYQVYCQVYVPLELEDASKNVSYGDYGMRTKIQSDDATKQTLQLQGPEVSGGISSYLVKLKNVQYKSGVSNLVTSGSAIFASEPALMWESSDTTVVTVDSNGIVTAVGAGYAEITVSTLSVSSQGEEKTLTFPVIVAPTATINNTSLPYKEKFTYTATSSTVTIDTNAFVTDRLVWRIHKKSITGETLDLKDNDLMDVYLSSVSGSVTLSNIKAGVYYITACPSDKYLETNGNVKKLEITLIVPIILPTGPIYMNVGDTYKILENANLPSTGIYSFQSNNPNVATVTTPDGVITGLEKGDVVISMLYNASNGLYDTLTPEEQKNYYKSQVDLPVHVIDGISLSQTNATMYVGGTVQLLLNTSNIAAPITWTSSDEKVAKVDENGLVTGVAAGSCEITVTQVINGVTKKAVCKVLVKSSVTSIVLDPSSASLEMGSYLTINATVTPKLSNASLKWVTSDEKIVSITQTGDLSATVMGVAGGTAVITAINQDNVMVGSCMITVYQGIEKITLSETSVTAPLSAGSFQLFATITPTSAKNQEVVWTSTDPSVITVDTNGKVTLKKAGNAAILVTSKVNATISAICTVTVTKSVASLKLETTSKAMYVGETYRLYYTIAPADASSSAVTWTSTNTSIASVNAEGLISAKAVGTAVIIARTKDGGFVATCTITVSRTATAVKLDVTKLTLNVGDYYSFITTLTPADSTETTLTWQSSDTSVAVVSKSGRVTAKKAGQAIIMVKTKSGSTGFCTVKVLQGVTGIEISDTEATVDMGDKIELTASVIPSGATDQGISWESSDTDIATVDKDGVVKGISGGVAIITATSDDGGYVAHCILTVVELITEITLNKTYYKLGLNKTFRLEATIKGPNATNQKLKWTTSDKSIVTVDQKGRIKGIKLGTATVYAKATDGSGAYAACVVRVSRLVTSIDLNVNYITIVQGHSYQLKSTVKPSNATYKTPVYSSDKTDIAIVDKTGLITALSPGNCIVTAAANDSSGVSAICYVKVIAPVASTGITVSESEVVMSPGENKTVPISIVPNNSTDTYTWSSDNEMVAKVNKNTGNISAQQIGTANITVMTESGRRATIKVFVVGLSRTSLTLEQYTSTNISLEVDGRGASEINVRWDVDNQEIATVVGGKVTGRAIGTTYVHAVVNGRRLSCKVKVEKIK